MNTFFKSRSSINFKHRDLCAVSISLEGEADVSANIVCDSHDIDDLIYGELQQITSDR